MTCLESNAVLHTELDPFERWGPGHVLTIPQRFIGCGESRQRSTWLCS